jgi:Ca2+-dependent lipid-binding protein
VIKGKNLKNADVGLMFGKSDPYVKISGVGVPVRTKVIEDNVNPIWNETFHFLIDRIDPNPNLLIEVFDKDVDNDDFLGGFVYSLCSSYS